MRDESGFSLLEVIISIAALTLISGFIIQMFTASLYLNRKAYDLDMGSNEAARALETLDAENITGGNIITWYYDSQWGQVIIDQPGSEPMNNVNLILPDSVRYILTVSAEEDSSIESDAYTMFDSGGGYVISAGRRKGYQISAAVSEIKDDNRQEEIVSISTRGYSRTG